MHGVITQIKATDGKRDDLIAILKENETGMPGCLSYSLAKDLGDPDAIWITEVWENAAAHQASLQLPSVQNAIARARPIMAGMGPRFETEPV